MLATRPFSHVGVDYAGPVKLKAACVRGVKITKGYIAVFVCLSTKAVHLEVASDLARPPTQHRGGPAGPSKERQRSTDPVGASTSEGGPSGRNRSGTHGDTAARFNRVPTTDPQAVPTPEELRQWPQGGEDVPEFRDDPQSTTPSN